MLPQSGGPGWRKALCCARILMGDFSRWEGWEYRSDYSANLWLNRPLPIPMWDGSLTDHLFILAEEGIGDEVLFMSLLPEALCRSRKVTVECDQRLESVLRRSFPRTETLARRGDLSGIRKWLDRSARCAISDTSMSTTASSAAAPSAWLLMGDLARYFRRDKAHFPGRPYLRPNPERVREMERFRGRTGVSWAGNHGRYTPQAFTACLEQPLNLQYNETSPLLEEPGIDLKNDLEGLFALCSVLGRVVTVSTSIAHIAGSVGCPVDVIHAPPNSGGKNDMDILNWKWPEAKTPWYGSARVFRNLKQYEMTHAR